MRRGLCAGLLLGVIIAGTTALAAPASAIAGAVAPAAAGPLDVPWRDDFNTLDPNVWRAVDNGCYKPTNATVTGGQLHLNIAKGTTLDCPYTWVRYNTYGKKDFGPGTISARIRFNTAPGSWQTFWLTGGSGRVYPSNGEMDVAEIIGREPTTTHAALHSAYRSNPSNPTRRCDVGGATPFPVDKIWHTYSVTYSATSVTFKIDKTVLGTYKPGTICEFPFGDRQRIQLSARTGKYGGTVDPTKYPLAYDVDWIAYTPATV